MEDSLPYQQKLFRYIVILFSLTNAPALLQKMIDTIFQHMEECIWYLDNIIIDGNNTEVEHQAIVEKILQECVKQGLAVNLLKSEFHIHVTILLRHVINSQEVKIDLFKLATMSKSSILIKKKEVQAFVAFANYDRRFIVNDNAKAHTVIDLTKDVACT